jgi:hypothetical protein
VRTAVTGINLKLYPHFPNFETVRPAINFHVIAYINRIISRNRSYNSSHLDGKQVVRRMKNFAVRAGEVLNQVFYIHPLLFLEIMIILCTPLIACASPLIAVLCDKTLL